MTLEPDDLTVRGWLRELQQALVVPDGILGDILFELRELNSWLWGRPELSNLPTRYNPSFEPLRNALIDAIPDGEGGTVDSTLLRYLITRLGGIAEQGSRVTYYEEFIAARLAGPGGVSVGQSTATTVSALALLNTAVATLVDLVQSATPGNTDNVIDLLRSLLAALQLNGAGSTAQGQAMITLLECICDNTSPELPPEGELTFPPIPADACSGNFTELVAVGVVNYAGGIADQYVSSWVLQPSGGTWSVVVVNDITANGTPDVECLIPDQQRPVCIVLQPANESISGIYAGKATSYVAFGPDEGDSGQRPDIDGDNSTGFAGEFYTDNPIDGTLGWTVTVVGPNGLVGNYAVRVLVYQSTGS